VILLLVATVLLGQLHLLGVAWFGELVPDPIVVLAAITGLHWKRGRLIGAALVLGWGRSLVLLEPAGAHILCAALALTVVASQREAFDRDRGATLLFAALLAAGCWMGGAGLLGALADLSISAGPSLLTGALLALPLALPTRRVVRLVRRRA
jgi:hypothetical protein